MPVGWTLPNEVWQLPLPVLILILLSSGILVTRREHRNMTALMEYFRDLVEKKDTTIANQSEAVKAYKEVAETATKTFETMKKLADESEKGRKDVSS